MSKAVGVKPTQAEKKDLMMQESVIERLIEKKDFGGLSPEERRFVTLKMCRKYNLDPLLLPFQFLKIDGRVLLYATKAASDALALSFKLSQEAEEIITSVPGVVIVKASYVDQEFLESGGKRGRREYGLGAASSDLKGLPLANGVKKASTQAKRRAVLSMVCPGVLDESEIIDIPGAKIMTDEDEDTKASKAKPVTPEKKRLTM